MDPLQWMGAVRMRVQTADKNITIILYYHNNNYGFGLKQWSEVKNVLMLDLFQLLSSPDVNWWTGDYCDVFIRLSFWRHPFTAEHPLLRQWWKLKKQFHFCVNYLFSLFLWSQYEMLCSQPNNTYRWIIDNKPEICIKSALCWFDVAFINE